MSDVSSIGLSVRITASNTFPNGFTVTSYADDGDNGVTENIEIADEAVGLNGDLITWSKTSKIPYTVNVIPNTEDAQNLDILLKANRATKYHRSAKDIITIVETNPTTLKTRTLREGHIKSGAISDVYGSDGRIKTKQFTFVFSDVV